MIYKTLETLTQDIIYEVSQVPGVSVQAYAEPIIQRKIQHQFNRVFSKQWWRQFYTPSLVVNYSSHTGLPTNDFSASPHIKGLEDIRWIFPIDDDKPLDRLPDSYNRELITGTSPRFWEPNSDDSKLFRILPIPDKAMAAAEDTSSYSVVISYRVRPDDYSTSDIVKFDSLYLTYAVCHDLLLTDADNPGDVEKYREYMQDRFDDLTKDLVATFPLTARREATATRWFSR